MTKLTNNFNWFAAFTIGGILAAVSWFFASGLFSTVIGVLIGAGIAFFADRRTQRNAWKREYGIKIAEQIYGQLYGQTISIIEVLQRTDYQIVSFGFWESAQKDHKYFMVEEKFRDNLDAFLKKTQNYGSTINLLENSILPRIVRKSCLDTFQIENYDSQFSIQMEFRREDQSSSLSTGGLNYLLERKCSFSNFIKQELESLQGTSKKQVSITETSIHYRKMDSSVFSSNDLDKITKFWDECIKNIMGSPEDRFIIKEKQVLLEETKQVQLALAKRIEEPWRI